LRAQNGPVRLQNRPAGFAFEGPEFFPNAQRLQLRFTGMSSTTEVQTVSTGADKAKLAGAVLLAVGAVAAFYLLGKEPLWLRVIALLVGLGIAAAVFFISEPGKQLIGFGRDAVKETRKVVWPTRKESFQMTGYVFAFVVVMALFLWLTDKTLEWVLYDLLLNWRN
jgi:preprotein translocase subunit SecE